MTLVTTNNNRAVMARALKQVVPAVGSLAFSGTGQKLMWDGLSYAATKGVQLAKSLRGKKGKRKDIIAHPGAFPGAVAAPVAISRAVRGSRPKFSRGTGSVTVTHRELVAQINTTAVMTVNNGVTGNLYKVNPSNPNLFPWLQSISSNFDQYRFDSLRVQYIPMCATTETGRAAIYFDKDSEDPAPTDRQELSHMYHLTEMAPWAESNLQIPTDKIKRFMNDSPAVDRKLVDLGQVGFATYGGVDGHAAGDVFIHYTVTFFEPQPSAGLVDTSQTGTGSFDTGPDFVDEAATSTTTTLTFRSPGTYLVVMIQRMTTFVGVTPVSVTFNSHTNTVSLLSHYASVHCITAPVAGAQMQYVGTGFGNYTLSVARAKTTNSANLI
jgi:hypothetical protein